MLRFMKFLHFSKRLNITLFMSHSNAETNRFNWEANRVNPGLRTGRFQYTVRQVCPGILVCEGKNYFGEIYNTINAEAVDPIVGFLIDITRFIIIIVS